MSIREETISRYSRFFAESKASGKLMIFGRPTLRWDNAPSPEDFFKGYGFDEVHTLDVSPYQGASHIHDLNLPAPPELLGQYDVVMTAGTLEHVFNAATALQTAAALTAVGGRVFCGGPVNNWVDHGFWQVSPTLMFDYFAENGWQFEQSVATVLEKDGHRSFALYPREGHHLNRFRARVVHLLAVRRMAESTTDRIPTQGLYLDIHDGAQRKFRFRPIEPLETRDGVDVPIETARFHLSQIRPLDGRFAAKFSDKAHPASLPKLPFRSKALVYEDGKLLPWIVSEAGMVKEREGSFHHGPGFVHFSTTDGTDPRENGRAYEVAFPVGFRVNA